MANKKRRGKVKKKYLKQPLSPQWLAAQRERVAKGSLRGTPGEHAWSAHFARTDAERHLRAAEGAKTCTSRVKHAMGALMTASAENAEGRWAPGGRRTRTVEIVRRAKAIITHCAKG